MIYLAWCALATLALASRVTTGSWRTPSTFFAAYWALMVFAALLVQSEVPIRAEGLFTIDILVASLVAGGAAALPSRHASVAPVAPSGRPWWTGRVRRSLLALTLVATSGWVILIPMSADQFGLDISAESVMQLGHEASVARYAYGEALNSPWYLRWATFLVYAAAPLGGILFRLSPRWRDRIAALSPLLLALLAAVIEGARAGMAMAFAGWAGGHLAASVAVTGPFARHRESTKSILGVLVASLLSAVLLFSVVQWIRGGTDKEFRLYGLEAKGIASIFGSVGAFASWDADRRTGELSLGAYTFGGPADLLGLAERRQGTYSDFRLSRSGIATNIYTAFRGLIQDFSMAGAMVFLAAVGWLANRGFTQTGTGRAAPVVASGLFYSWALYSYYYSLFNFNSLTAGWLVALALASLWDADATRIRSRAHRDAVLAQRRRVVRLGQAIGR